MRALHLFLMFTQALLIGSVHAADKPATGSPPVTASAPQPHQQPAWFKESFLDIRDDIAEASNAKRRVMLYFYQEGCPYCTKLLNENFGQKTLADKARKHFDVIAINIWGDREVKDINGQTMPEKAFAKALGVQFTPSLVMLDEKGNTALRLNGYTPPHQFTVALDFVSQRLEKKQKYIDYLQAHASEPATGQLHPEPWLMTSPLNLTPRTTGDKRPLLVLFEQKVCAACDEMHRDAFPRPEVAELLKKFQIARVDIASNESLKTPGGNTQTMRDWTRKLNIIYTPSLLYFDSNGKEIFRVEGYLRPFHLSSSLDYVASGEYLKQPEFQRFIEAKAAARRAKGERVELMK